MIILQVNNSENNIEVFNSSSASILNSPLYSEDKRMSTNGPNLVKISNSGAIIACVIIAARSNLLSFDINLNKNGETSIDGSIRCATIFEWYDGKDILFVATRNQKLILFIIPTIKKIWETSGIDCCSVAVMKNPRMSLIVGTMHGKIINIPLEEELIQDDDISESLEYTDHSYFI